jgi:hypothetical protein
VIGQSFTALTVDPTATTLPAASVDTKPTAVSTPRTPSTTKAPPPSTTTTLLPAEENC